MRRAERPRRHKRFLAVETTGNAVNLGRLDRFIERHRRNNCWNALRQHRLARAGRANHENVVTAGNCDFDCPFDVSLSFHVCKIDIVILMGCKKTGEIAAGWEQRKFAPKKLECLAQIVDAVDVDLVHHRGFESVRFRHKERLLAATPRFQSDRKHAFNRTHTAVERQFADETELFQRGSIQPFRDRNHSERDRKVEARPFFFDVGWRQIDRRSLARPFVGAVRNRCSDAILAFLHGGIGQTDDDHLWIARAGVDLDFHFVSVNAINRGRINLSQHGRGERLGKALQKISKAKRGKYLRILVLFALANLVSLNILRKIEQSQLALCQYSDI